MGPLTLTVTLSDCAVLRLASVGLTETAGVACVEVVTVTCAVPVEDLYVDELAPSGVYVAVNVLDPAASDPAGMVIVTVPPLSGVDGEI